MGRTFGWVQIFSNLYPQDAFKSPIHENIMYKDPSSESQKNKNAEII